MIATNVGVQPTTGPSWSNHSRVRYAEANDNVAAGEEASVQIWYSIFRYWYRSQMVLQMQQQLKKVLVVEQCQSQILKQTVEAKLVSYKQDGHLSPHKMHKHNKDLTLRLRSMAALAQEITAETTQEILGSLRSLAATEETSQPKRQYQVRQHSVGDEHAALAVLIQQNC